MNGKSTSDPTKNINVKKESQVQCKNYGYGCGVHHKKNRDLNECQVLYKIQIL